VAVPTDRDPQPVRHFSTFTRELEQLADGLKPCGMETVAMESPGVFWIPLLQILEDRGCRVCLVNARQVKHVPGRKTDVADGQWRPYLHAVGLLRASHRPPQAICALRSLGRHRESLVQTTAIHIQHMPKALEQMNIQRPHVSSDITGTTGLAMVEAVLAGERHPKQLARRRDPRMVASEETVAAARLGDYRPEHLLVRRQSLPAYRQYPAWMADGERETERLLAKLESRLAPGSSALHPRTGTSRGGTSHVSICGLIGIESLA